MHVLLRVEARRTPRWHATKVLADFWLEDEEAYKARTKAITAGALVLMTANSQGAEKFLCPTRTHCLERGVPHMGGVEYQDPNAHIFLWEYCLRANMPGSHPDSGCPRLFQTIKVAHMTLFSQMQQP